MAAVPVRVEPPGQNPVVEVGYDGQELTQPALTMSENLAKLARKVDFSQTEEGDTAGEKMKTEEEETEDTEVKSFQQPAWPWESVRNALRSALTELCVASDVLAIASKECGKDKRYMALDGPVQAEDPEPKHFVQLIAKKKALEVPSKILLAGAEHLRELQAEGRGQVPGAAGAGPGQKQEDFHIELLKLRQNWRLKKLGGSILGDLSYRTAGSKYKHPGVFEVSKADEEAANNGLKLEKNASSLKVVVPSELEGIAYIQVTIQRDNEQLVSASLGNLTSPTTKPVELHWQQQLEAAQNVLFCKELFSQLAREAVALQAPIPHMVVGSQITASLFPDIQLIISLCHSTPHSSSKSASSASANKSANDHSHVLEHSLHQLLRKVHRGNINPDGPGLSSGPVGIPRKRRLAGPEGADRHSLLEMSRSETLLEQIVRQAQHVVLRLRTIFVLDTLAREFKDPLLTSHWSTLSSPTCSSVKVSVVSAGYDTIIKTQLVIHVGEKMLRVICKDGRVLLFSYEPQELRDFILCQISQHQVTGVQALARVCGWQVLASSCFLGSGAIEPFGSAAGCLLANNKGDKFVAVRHSPHANATVFISQAPCSDFFATPIIQSSKWENLPEGFKQLKLDRMDGKNLLNKIELLMAALS